MDKPQVLARLQTLFDDVFIDEVVVTEELSARDVEEWDSLSHVSLVLAVEETFGVRFRVGEVESAKNVGELADLILRRLEKG
jgi:acyl carrier protein